MLFLSNYILLIFSLILSLNLFGSQEVESGQQKHLKNNPSLFVSDEVWKQVRDYLMPEDHPIKKKLDLIFSSSRALCNQRSMEAVGFNVLPPQHHTQMIVAKHSELQGYVIKAYYDEQDYYAGRPEYYYWVKRVKGAELIRKYIKKNSYTNLFKVPKKWIYLLPDDPSPPANFLRKIFILVAEDMKLFDPQSNEVLWGSGKVTEEFLDALYAITTDLGLLDSAKPANCAFSMTDGNAAFIDTELYHGRHVKYEKLTPFLSPTMRSYWETITQKK